MKQLIKDLRTLLTAGLILLLIGSILSCRTRKVVTEKDSFSDKTKTSEQVRVKEKSTEKSVDKSKTVQTKSDSVKTQETEETEITADEVVVDKDGKTTYKGNVKFKGKKQVNTAKGSQSRLERLKDLSTDKSVSKDSSGKKSEDRDVKLVEKKKDAHVSNVSLLPFVVVVGILLLLAFIAVRWNALTRFWRKLVG